MKEIERKYIARLTKPFIHADEEMAIEQSYILVRKSFEWRVRMALYFRSAGADDLCCRYEIVRATALKIGNGYVRGEYEWHIWSWLYRVLMWLVPKDTTIFKDRIDSGGWSVDLFGGDLYGLVLAEYEVQKETDPAPALPDGLELVRDVTDDGRFANKRLSRMSKEARALLVREATEQW